MNGLANSNIIKMPNKIDKIEKQVAENTKQIKFIWSKITELEVKLFSELKSINVKLDKPKNNIWQIILYLLAGGMITMLFSMLVFG